MLHEPYGMITEILFGWPYYPHYRNNQTTNL